MRAPTDSMPVSRRSIVFRVDEDAIFEGLVQATGECFPDHPVQIVQSLEKDKHQSAALILLRAEQYPDIVTLLKLLREKLPDTAIGVIVNDALPAPKWLAETMSEELAHGILPLNLPLKVWLAAIWLLLRGGRYLPPDLWKCRKFEVDEHLQAAEVDGGCISVNLLTPREQEVHMHLSAGCQNKIIAARLDLSEHTVKVHVHNIITKLGVHNRTEAANLFRLSGKS